MDSKSLDRLSRSVRRRRGAATGTQFLCPVGPFPTVTGLQATRKGVSPTVLLQP